MKIKIDFFIQKLYYAEFEIYFKCNIKQEKYIFMLYYSLLIIERKDLHFRIIDAFRLKVKFRG